MSLVRGRLAVRALSRPPYLRCLRCRQPCFRRLYATAPAGAPASPLLSKLREDLKAAMRAKDSTRLSVLRSLLADITNASKTPTPINNDIALLSLLRKRIAAGRTAADEFAAANRADLVEKEQAQIRVMESYAGEVQTIGREEIEKAAEEVLGALNGSAGAKATIGDMMRRLTGPGGVFDGKPVEKKDVASIAKAVLERSRTDR